VATLYPTSHADAVAKVLHVVDLIAARPDSDDAEIVAALVRDGVGEVDAELLVRFVPCAFMFALLKRMGVSQFPGTFFVYNSRGDPVEMALAEEHYFAAALGLAHEVTTRGYNEQISKETFQAVTRRSAEMAAVNKALAAGHTVEELAAARLRPPMFFGVTAEQVAASRPSPGAGRGKRWWNFWQRPKRA
jgi:hypothetical protein